MAPRKKFPCFKELPTEIQLEIWKLSCTVPRVIKAESVNMIGEDHHFKSVYRLSGGPVPKVLQICHQSRVEGLKLYSAIRSYAATNTDSEKWFTENNDYRVYINFDIDTIFFTSLQPMFSTLTWIRINLKAEMMRLKKITDTAGKVSKVKVKTIETVKHMAIAANEIYRLNNTTPRLDLLYGIAVQNQNLQSITVVFDCSAYSRSKYPHTYIFNPLPPPLGSPETLKNRNTPNPSWFGQGATGSMDQILHGFWDNSEKMSFNSAAWGHRGNATKYREFRESEKGKKWKAPKLESMKIVLDKSRHKKGQ